MHNIKYQVLSNWQLLTDYDLFQDSSGLCVFVVRADGNLAVSAVNDYFIVYYRKF